MPRGVKDNAEEEVERYNQILADHPVDLQILGIGRNGHIGLMNLVLHLTVKTPCRAGPVYYRSQCSLL